MKVVIIGCGSSSGIGSYLRQQLLIQGNQVFGIGRSGPDVSVDLVNATAEDVAGAFSKATEVLGGLPDVLINNIGGLDFKYIDEMTSEDFSDSTRLNLGIPLDCSREFVKLNPNGKIVNISSVAAQMPLRGYSSYCASKAGLEMLTKVIARENPGVTAVNVAPASVEDTPMVEYTKQETKKRYDLSDAEAESRTMLPIGRQLRKSEIWSVIDFILTDMPKAMRGTTFKFPAGNGS